MYMYLIVESVYPHTVALTNISVDVASFYQET